MNQIDCNNSPAKHHQSSLGIGSWRQSEYWAINNSEGINTDHPEVTVGNFIHKAAPVVMPNGAHCPAAEINHSLAYHLIDQWAM